jgi:hypothetical protein
MELTKKRTAKEDELQYKLPTSILHNIGKILAVCQNHHIENLKQSLENNPYVLSPFFYQNIEGDRKYCVIGLLAGINKPEFSGQSDIAKVRVAHYFATRIRKSSYKFEKNQGDEALLFEEYLKDRWLRQRKTTLPLLTKNEVQEIIDLCTDVLGRRKIVA